MALVTVEIEEGDDLDILVKLKDSKKYESVRQTFDVGTVFGWYQSLNLRPICPMGYAVLRDPVQEKT